ncbi:MAG: extracellular solute-binding protein [Gammaproteobacteria bacterium]|jgi:sn-glycerol 3-phosphate transport system substrate-binding protein|nr:extracellular solute-binding protein [Gammaproteobacteria bacterium]MBU0772802.1 extracellular solute-binding protein [Gammaproteobacteria bacterium]MBU0856536.1 extracellular solute-binding protein [Gammaproteobacteria bacterium]MBU1847570.1 extracellular solute-binding protein [Gammaproteobacteria bacterium]
MFLKPLAALVAASVMVLSMSNALAADAKKAAPAKKSAAKKPAVPAESAELELVYVLDDDSAQALQGLIDEFNASGKGKQKIVLSTRNWEEGKLPALLLLDDAARQRFLDGKPRFTPLHQVMASAKEKFAPMHIPAAMPPYLSGAKGRLNALPIGLTTPVMFYNKDAFARVGLNPDAPPDHWLTLQAALGTLRDGGYACPYTSARPALIHVDNLSAWHNEPFARKSGKSGEALAINGLVQVKHLALMSSWYKSRYLHIFGRGDEAVPMFSGGQCQVLTARSSAWPQIQRDAKFNVGVAALPFHDDIRQAPGHTLADGSSLWVSEKRGRDDIRTIASLVTFILDPERQARWALATGFIPLNRAGMVAISPVDAPTVDGVARVALRQLSGRPGAPASATSVSASNPSVRAVLDEELESLWADRLPAKAVLDNAVKRVGPCAAASSLSC